MTYSIVARDKKTWQLWIAVQTHWFGVGNNVPWLESGIGAIATQAQTNMDYGKIWLQLLGKGKYPEEVIKEIWSTDEAFESRQVAIIDTKWNIWVHTGSACIKYAWYLLWEDFVVQGNILSNEKVLPAMKQAYEKNIDRDFSMRLYLSLQAGQEVGWELRWTQSAAMRIVPSELHAYDIMNLRIDDHINPLQELKRQLSIQQAYNYLNQAEEEWVIGSVEKSLELFSHALDIIPESKEFLFWKAFMLKNRGKKQEAEKILIENFKEELMWQELWNRIH